MEEERKTFTFFRSYSDAAKRLHSSEDALQFLLAVADYALDGIEPVEISPVAGAMFDLVKPTLDASKAKAKSGANGGLAKAKSSKPLANASKPLAKSSKPLANSGKAEETSSEEGSMKKEEGSKELPSDEGSKKKPPQEKLAEFVTMTAQEHESLVQQFGEVDTLRLIDILNNYKGSTGKRYKSDYRAILSWCVQRLNEEKRKAGNSKQTHTQVQPHGADPARVRANAAWMRSALDED